MGKRDIAHSSFNNKLSFIFRYDNLELEWANATHLLLQAKLVVVSEMNKSKVISPLDL